MDYKDTVMGEREIFQIHCDNRKKDEDTKEKDILQAQAEISFKAGVKEAIKVYTPYVRGLEAENGSLIGFASTHGWRSSQVEFGKQCREKIKRLKASGKPS